MSTAYGAAMNVWIIGANTFREAVRNRVLYVLVVFGLLVIAASKLLGWVLIGEDLKIIADIGLSALSVFGAMIAVFVGTGLIYKEIEKHTIFVVLARPVARWEYIIGKYLGLLLTVLVMVGLMSLGFIVYLWIMSNPAWVLQEVSIAQTQVKIAFGGIVYAIAFTFMEMVLLTAVVIGLSAASTPILSAVFSSLAYMAGHLADRIYDLALIVRQPQLQEGSEFGYTMLMFVYYLVPNLAVFNIRNEAVHGLTGQYGWDWTLLTVLYGLLYASACLLLGIVVFRRRNF